MGTRSACGVRIGGEDKLAYNHLDGYPDWVGQQIVNELRTDAQKRGFDVALARWRDLATKARLVNEDHAPTQEEIGQYARHADLDVSSRSPEEWYVLLRNLQGTVVERLEAGVFLNGNDFVKDSLCEWAYVVNLDAQTFEVYKGFQKAAHEKRRYDAVALIKTLPLAELLASEKLLTELLADVLPRKDDEDN